jgi:hypothetical protein
MLREFFVDRRYDNNPEKESLPSTLWINLSIDERICSLLWYLKREWWNWYFAYNRWYMSLRDMLSNLMSKVMNYYVDDTWRFQSGSKSGVIKQVRAKSEKHRINEMISSPKIMKDKLLIFNEAGWK